MLKVRASASGRVCAVRVEAKQWASKGGVLIPPAWNKRVVVPEVEARDTPKVRERERSDDARRSNNSRGRHPPSNHNRGALARALALESGRSMRIGRAKPSVRSRGERAS
jgi:hypothetical protein